MAMGIVEKGFDTYIFEASLGNVDVHRWVSTLDVRLSCIQCHTRMLVAEEIVYKPGIPEGVVKFCEMHRHEGNKVDCDPDMSIGGCGSGYFGEDIQIGFKQPVVAINTELVLTIAKASNFNVDLQGRSNRLRTQYRLHCKLCKAEMNLDTRIVTKEEIEDHTTATSKFCIEHSHTINVKAVANSNYRKFRDE